jgi:translation elongation factor EF-G
VLRKRLVFIASTGNVIGALNQRKGTIADTEMRDDEFTLVADVSLNDMFGCASGSSKPSSTHDGSCRLVPTSGHDSRQRRGALSAQIFAFATQG